MCVRGWVGEGDACVCVCARVCVLCGYMAWVCGCSTEPQTTPVDLLLFAEMQRAGACHPMANLSSRFMHGCWSHKLGVDPGGLIHVTG